MSLHTLQQSDRVVVLSPPVNNLEKEVLVRAFQACAGFIFGGDTHPQPEDRFKAEAMCNIVLASRITNPIVVLLRPKSDTHE